MSGCTCVDMGVCVTVGYVVVEAAEMDQGAPAMYRYNNATGELKIAFDAARPTEAAAALTCLFAQLQDAGILDSREPRGITAGL